MEERVVEKQRQAEKRAKELKSRIADYLCARQDIRTGFERREIITQQRERIRSLLGGTEKDWYDWRWQVKNRISDVELLGEILHMPADACKKLELIGEKYRWSISPYYLSLIDPQVKLDPVRLQAIPSEMEMKDKRGTPDPMAEELTSPAPCVTRRYPDRLIIKVTNQCAMYCRHCQRRRSIGEVDRPEPRERLAQAVEYVQQHEEIRDVLLTGGDAFLLSNKRINWLLRSLREIPHVEILRLGTRTLVTMPMRVDEELVSILANHHPVYVNTQFNHPQEITEDAARACDMLTRGGIVLGNQMVLLRGINANAHTIKKLNHELLKIRVLPYYIFHAKGVQGTTHFRSRIETGIEIMENLRGSTSGLAIPTYIINAPGGYGKTPANPQYIVSWGPDSIKLRTWEGRVLDYPNYLGEWNDVDIL